MKKRLANKIFAALYAYKSFETDRQPYSIAQQRKAIKVLKIPTSIRPTLRLCQPTRKHIYWESRCAVKSKLFYMLGGNAAYGNVQHGLNGQWVSGRYKPYTGSYADND